MVKKLLYILLLPLLLMGCSSDDDNTPDTHIRRTIMVYFNAENNIYNAADTDLNEIVNGSRNLASDCNLLVYFDDLNNPVLYRIKNGNKEAIKTYSPDIDSSDPDNMLSVFQTMIAMSPSDEYATVFWGHGDGPIIANGTSSSSNTLDIDFSANEANTYGADYNSNDATKSSNATFIDIPQLAKVMKQLPIPQQEFIFFDACCMQSVEVAYELRNCAKYIIGATCETPAFGAPYSTTTRLLGLSDTESAAKAIVNEYQNQSVWQTWQTNYHINNVCMSVVRTEHLDELLSATRTALHSLYAATPLVLTTTFPSDEHEATSCIYYYKTKGSRYGYPILYDINDVMLHNLSSEDYATWRAAFDKAVIYHPSTGDIRDTRNCDWYGGDSHSIFTTLPAMTISNFRSFYLSDDTFGGLSFFMPRSEYATNTYPNMNTRMYDYEWCREVGWKELGW